MNREFFETQLQKIGIHYRNILNRYEIPFSERILDNPSSALDFFIQLYNKATLESADDNPFILQLGGGAHESVMWPFYNAIGAVYSYLEMPDKIKAITTLLSLFDIRKRAEITGEKNGKFAYVGHTTGIHNGQLLTDICIARPCYWPGIDDSLFLLEESGTFENFASKYIDSDGYFVQNPLLHSKFLLAYTLLRPDFLLQYMGKNDFLTEKVVERLHPEVIDNTLQGIATFFFADRKNLLLDEKNKSIRYQKFCELLPESTHESLLSHIHSADWVDYSNFN